MKLIISLLKHGILKVAEHQELEQEGEASVIHKCILLNIYIIPTFKWYRKALKDPFDDTQ